MTAELAAGGAARPADAPATGTVDVGVTGAGDRAGALAVLRALVARDIAERRRLVPPLALDLAFGIVNLAVFLLISRVLSVPADGALGGSASYFDFVAVGITFMLVVQAATSQVTARVGQEQRDGTLEMLVTQPVPGWLLALGLAGYPFLLALLRAGVYLALLGLAFGLHVDRADWLGVVLILLAAAAAMLALGVGLMAFTVVFGRGDMVARLLLVGLAFVSGTYFPVAALSALPPWVTAALPSRIAVDGLRHALAGQRWAGELLALLGGTALLVPLSLWLFDLSLRLARRRGTLNRN
ncbi:ABC transporter permease [Micromonospora carbonacea]|uniref:ABC transporter permease n=1 Tax=Micromonospora carbonacea TaxID=47853 RepID=UPI00371A7D0B